jgi:hypothetical protein
VRRRATTRTAETELSVFVGLAVAAIAVAIRRRGEPAVRDLLHALRDALPVTALATAVGLGGVLARSLGAVTGGTLLAITAAAVLAPLLVAHAWGSVGSPRAVARGMRATFCGASVIAAALWLVETIAPTCAWWLGI